MLGNSSRRRTRPTIAYDRFDPEVSRQHPLVWTVDDIPELDASDAFIARKFDLSIDSGVLDYFDHKTIVRSV